MKMFSRFLFMGLCSLGMLGEIFGSQRKPSANPIVQACKILERFNPAISGLQSVKDKGSPHAKFCSLFKAKKGRAFFNEKVSEAFMKAYRRTVRYNKREIQNAINKSDSNLFFDCYLKSSMAGGLPSILHELKYNVSLYSEEYQRIQQICKKTSICLDKVVC